VSSVIKVLNFPCNLLEHNYYTNSDKGKIKVHHCSKCDKSYARRSSLWSHMQSHNSSITRKCPQCAKVLSFKRHLKRRLECIHKINTRKTMKCYFCSLRSQTYSENNELFNHMRAIHLKELAYKCRKNSTCTRRFATTSHAVSHSRCVSKDGRGIENTNVCETRVLLSLKNIL